MDILIKDMEPAQILDIFDKAGVRFNKNGEPIEFEIFHNDVGSIRHGHWDRDMECSICGCLAPVSHVTGEEYAYEYCPNCGAKMDGEEQENEQG